ncbi:MAG: phage portal protein [Planctomycetota bacterium]|nr:phage portal protein [Planctomycetota bacterium]
MWPFRKTKSGKPRGMPAVVRASSASQVSAKFDSAQTTPDNMRHWANADFLSANAAARPEVRRILRNRARYEVANNSYARGIVLTLANDVIGTGPRLQMLLGDGENEGANAVIEREFTAWAKAIDLSGKLRTMRMARAQDGEAFAMLVTNTNPDCPVKLDIKLVEADQVTNPMMWLPTPTFVDGIVLDENGNPKQYHVLDYHPGDFLHTVPLKYHVIPAGSMVHWFRADRPGQRRGIPEIMPALPLFAQLRRYTLAVLGAAETAADFAAVLFTDSPANGEAQSLEPMDVVALEKRMATVLPDGWRLGQVEAQQPTTTYDMFKREILNEIARCLNMPYNIAACNSSGYNYSSGRLDHQTYYKSIRVEQSHIEAIVLDQILDAWMAEAMRVYPELTGLTDWTHQWFWDGHEHVDPQKEASAQQQRLENNTTTLASEYARQGKDWETELRQRAKEVALMKELGLTVSQAVPTPTPTPAPAPAPGRKPQQVKEDQSDDQQPQPKAA